MFGKKLIGIIYDYVIWTDRNDKREEFSFELYESWFGRSIKVRSHGLASLYKAYRKRSTYNAAILWKNGHINLNILKDWVKDDYADFKEIN